MKPKNPSKANRPFEPSRKIQIRITHWEEDCFSLPIGPAPARVPRVIDDWEGEAIGAADDASRFRVDLVEFCSSALAELQF